MGIHPIESWYCTLIYVTDINYRAREYLLMLVLSLIGVFMIGVAVVVDALSEEIEDQGAIDVIEQVYEPVDAVDAVTSQIISARGSVAPSRQPSTASKTPETTGSGPQSKAPSRAASQAPSRVASAAPSRAVQQSQSQAPGSTPGSTPSKAASKAPASGTPSVAPSGKPSVAPSRL